jgi:membrane protein YdbS with pleckstrin-like domain
MSVWENICIAFINFLNNVYYNIIVDMSYLWSGKPYLKKTIVKFLLFLVVTTAFLFLVGFFLAASLMGLTMLWFIFMIVMATVFIPYYYNKRAYTYYVTDKSVRVEKSWVFGNYVRELTFDQLRDVHIMQGILARAMNCGSIAFVTTSGLETGHVAVGVGRGIIFGKTAPRLITWRGGRFWDVREPQRVHEILMGKIPAWREAYQQQRIATSVERITEGKTPRTESLIDELERLKRLLDEGAITKEEYEKAKKKILE